MAARNEETLPDPNGTSWSLFLDFDGTLTEIVAAPDQVRVDPALPETLIECQETFEGAVALVSGRTIEELDEFLSPARLPAAGLHGLVRRNATGEMEHHEPDGAALDTLRARLSRLAASDARLVIEDKRAAIAVHYRQAPERAEECRTLVEAAIAELAGFRILEGKMVVEATPIDGGKGRAISQFMGEAPFRGRTPVFAGDDTTDEDGFRFVNGIGGISIKVGEGESLASHRAPNVSALLSWLHRLPGRAENGR